MHRGPITAIAVSPDGREVYTGGYDKAIWRWNRVTGKEELLGKHVHLVNALTLSENGRWLASASSDYHIHLYDLENGGTLHRVLYGHSDDVEALVFTEQDSLLVSVSRDRRAFVWEVGTGAILQEFGGHSSDVLTVWATDSQVFTSGDDGRVLVWGLRDGRQIGELGPFNCEVDAVSGSSRMGLFAVGMDNGIVQLYQVSDLQLVRTIQAHEQGIKRVLFSPTGTRLLTAGYDHRIRIWSLDGESVAQELEPYRYQWERCFAWMPDERHLLGASFGGTYCEWELDSGTFVGAELERATPSINDFAVSKQGHVVTASDDGRFRLNGQEIATADGVLTNGVSIDADGRHAMWGDHAGDVHLVDLQSGAVTTIALHTGPINSVFFFAEGNRYYVGTYGGYIHVLDPETGELVSSWQAHPGAVKSVRVFDRHVVSCSADGSVHAFDRKTENLLQAFHGPTAIVNDIDIDDEGLRLAVVSRDKVVRLYDLASGRILGQHHEHRYSIKSVSITPDGRVFSGDYWGYVIEWSPQEDRILNRFRVAANGISALRTLQQDVLASSYDGGVYRITPDGSVQEVVRLFQQEASAEQAHVRF